MSEEELRHLLTGIRDGRVDIEHAVARLSPPSFEELGHTRIDHQRTVRRGYPEAIFCAGKTTEQVVEIAERMVAYGHVNVLATHASPDMIEALAARVPVRPYPATSLAVLNPIDTQGIGLVCVCTAGTSDMTVAEEAAITAECSGSNVERLYDVGVAGIHRLFAKTEVLCRANVVVVVAGMEGALPSVVAGLVSSPVIAVPTSVGYGANLGGFVALLSMLNSCSPGISVVNIDNGFGAGYQANLINRMAVGRVVDDASTVRA